MNALLEEPLIARTILSYLHESDLKVSARATHSFKAAVQQEFPECDTRCDVFVASATNY